jgi:hypothetical protein
MRRLVTLVAALALVVSACSSGTGGGGGTSNAKIAFLMPDIASTRYELYDSPLFKAKVKQLCADCEVLYQNANADADASRQQQQANSALAQGVKAIVIDRSTRRPRRASSTPLAPRACPSSPTTGPSRGPRPTTTSPSTTRRSASPSATTWSST